MVQYHYDRRRVRIKPSFCVDQSYEVREQWSVISLRARWTFVDAFFARNPETSFLALRYLAQFEANITSWCPMDMRLTFIESLTFLLLDTGERPEFEVLDLILISLFSSVESYFFDRGRHERWQVYDSRSRIFLKAVMQFVLTS